MEAAALRDRLNSEEIHLKNYISWPIYINDSDILKEWKARNKRILQMIEVGIDEKAVSYVESDRVYTPYDTIAHRYAWSRSLTKMRREIIEECIARICAGGRLIGYKGKLPGVLEEILIAAEQGCPLYLLGGFGGVTGSVCRTIQSGKLSEELTEEWQESRNEGYTELIKQYEVDGEPLRYEMIADQIKHLKLNNGLSEKENEILFTTVYMDEALRLVLKGLRTLKNNAVKCTDKP